MRAQSNIHLFLCAVALLLGHAVLGQTTPDTSSQSSTSTTTSTTTPAPPEGSSGTAVAPSTAQDVPPPPMETPAPPPSANPAEPAGGAPQVVVVPSETDKKNAELRGVGINLMGGVEGYMGSLAPRIRTGGTYGLNVVFRPTTVFGVELGYSGALNSINTRFYPGSANERGPDIIRNGGTAIITLALSATRVQPYVLAGVGINHYTLRGGQSVGFHDATNGAIPVGAGLRATYGHFIADARFTYSLPFGDSFSPGVQGEGLLGLNSNDSGRYQATLSAGVKF